MGKPLYGLVRFQQQSWFPSFFRNTDISMDALRILLSWLPWPSVLIIFCVTAYLAGGLQLAIFTFIALGYVLFFGYWEPTMVTLSLVFLSVPLSVSIGLVIGVTAFCRRRAKQVVMPALDIMQTFPTFAYLIPILFLLGFGPVVGLVAGAIYAIPPMVRNVILGLESVSPEVVDSGIMAGANPWQLLWMVRLPSASQL